MGLGPPSAGLPALHYGLRGIQNRNTEGLLGLALDCCIYLLSVVLVRFQVPQPPTPAGPGRPEYNQRRRILSHGRANSLRTLRFVWSVVLRVVIPASSAPLTPEGI